MKDLIEFERPVSSSSSCASLPISRKAAFKDLLKHHYFTLLKLGLSLLLFFVPFFIIFSLCSYNYDALYEQYQASQITQTVYLERTLSIYVYELLGLSLSLLLLCFPLSFFSRIFRSMCFYESFFFWSEAKKGFAQNFLRSFLSLLLFALLALGSSLLVLFVDFGTMNSNWVTSILAFLPLVALLLLLFPALLVSYPLGAIYKASFLKGISTSFKIYLNSFFPVLGFSLAFFLPFLSLLIPNSLIAGGILVVLIVIYYPVLLLGTWLYCLSRFDAFINKESYPSLYQKGLFI